ncbi:MAG: rod shape-determining protein MreD [Clostridia bacterium]|nr:rod shape-determining protein MreD [Clostridia bacterium]MBR6108581.1 rod shape-determining protein MreD [Clostridia bacterium]
MRKWLFALVVILAFYLDNVLFSLMGLDVGGVIQGLRPDITLCVIISFGVLLGPAPAALTGAIMGLIADLFFNKLVGPSAIVYMLAGAAGGFFYRKFYADNLIIPTVTCVVSFFIKEHILLVIARIAGARPPYFMTLISHILPCLILTGGVCMLIHLFLKHALFRPLWRNEAIKLD